MSDSQQHIVAMDNNVVKQVLTSCVVCCCSLLLAKIFMSSENFGEDDDKRQRKGVFGRLRIAARHFTKAEQDLVNQCLLLPEDVVSVQPEELVGPEMDRVLKQTRQLIQLSLHVPAGNRESVISQSRGILLFGPPGTGKTTVAKIVARENQCFFLNITADVLRHKEYGKTEKMVAAIFSVTAKLWELHKGRPKRPTIIFMDEIDNILGGKESSHEAYLAARSIFAQKWDGIQKTPGTIVMGTTNYPEHLPGFIYRRFLSRTQVPLPSEASRRAILRRFVVSVGFELGHIRDDIELQEEEQLGIYLDAPLLSMSVLQQDPLAPESMAIVVSQLKQVLSPQVRSKIETVIQDSTLHPLEKLARLTVGYSGSDLKDVVFHGMPDMLGTEKVTESSLFSGLAKVHTHTNRAMTRARCAEEFSLGTLPGLPLSGAVHPAAEAVPVAHLPKQTQNDSGTGIPSSNAAAVSQNPLVN